jgi:hypothetical protein
MSTLLFILAYGLIVVIASVIDRLLTEKDSAPPGRDELLYLAWCREHGRKPEDWECGRFEDWCIRVEMVLMDKHIPTRA